MAAETAAQTIADPQQTDAARNTNGIPSGDERLPQAVPKSNILYDGRKAKMSLVLTCSAFTQGHPIPKKYTGQGIDVSPPLAWSGAPEGTKEFVLICDDPDAPVAEPWVHWVIYKLPADTASLPEGIPRKSKLKEPAGALQGKNSWPPAEALGYRGPMPPRGHGVHHYYFKLYALDVQLNVEPGLDKKTILQKMDGHVIGEGALMGTYERK
jgi:Raf kinase inhibitor-like YbhB/YbcL family protein